jgi:glucose/arabinose dehydrogenase/PKD repeat protein
MATAFLPDGRMLVIEKPGRVLITDPDDGTGETAVYLNLSGRVDDRRERGLLDVTVDPNVTETGHVYLFYSNAAARKNRIARFTHAENGGGLASTASPSSEFVVWEETHQWTSCCHQGAGLDFGPDGRLWATTGDDFNFLGGAISQDLSRPDGKIIRVNSDGTIPADNPYAGDGDPDTLGEIWASGLRNPFRAEWDLESERLFVGDVGGTFAPDFEEVNVATLANAGANYGWPDCEGTSKAAVDAPCDVDQTAPLYAYPHDVGNAIVGGEVYRGRAFPPEYRGAYFFGDFARGWISYLTFDADGEVATVTRFTDDAERVVHIAVGPDGALYWTSLQGSIHRITYAGRADGRAPRIEATSATPATATNVPLTVAFDASATDPDGDPLAYEWRFGDGSTATGPAATHTYREAGIYAATVTVSDGTRSVVSDPIEIRLGEPPTVRVDAPADGASFRAGEEIRFAASGADPQDGRLGEDAFSWTVVFDHDPAVGAPHDHPVLTDYAGRRGSFTVPTAGHSYVGDTSYTLTVTATDSDGLPTSASVTVEPETSNVTFRTDPRDLAVTVDDRSLPDGTTWDTLVGFRHEVRAPARACRDGTAYAFRNWSDGGARAHTYTVPDADATLTARYRAVETPAPAVGTAAPARDPDCDGLFEDVNGDGVAAPGDATVLFNAVFDGNPAVTEHVALFDFNGDGAVTPGDATVLFDEIFEAGPSRPAGDLDRRPGVDGERP